MSLYLSIVIKENPYGYCDVLPHYPFLCVMKDVKWIYALSDTQDILDKLKEKIIKMTPTKYLKYMKIHIGNLNGLSDKEIAMNGLNKEYDIDVFYLEGVCNNGRRYKPKNLTLNVWNWWR